MWFVRFLYFTSPEKYQFDMGGVIMGRSVMSDFLLFMSLIHIVENRCFSEGGGNCVTSAISYINCSTNGS